MKPRNCEIIAIFVFLLSFIPSLLNMTYPPFLCFLPLSTPPFLKARASGGPPGPPFSHVSETSLFKSRYLLMLLPCVHYLHALYLAQLQPYEDDEDDEGYPEEGQVEVDEGPVVA